VLLVIGSRLSWRQIRSDPDNFSKFSRIIHIDIDDAELNENVECSILLNIDAGVFVSNLIECKSRHTNRSKYIEDCKKLTKTYTYLPKEENVNEKFLHPHYVVSEISNFASSNAIFCLDTGQNLIWSIQGLESKGNRKFISSWGHSPMGYAICASLGAIEVPNQEEVVCITGDGGIQMNIQELQTILLNNYNIKIIVINNNSLGAIKEFQDDNLDSRHVGTGSNINYKAPNFTKIALAYNIHAKEIDSKSDFKKEIKEFFAIRGPALLDIKVSETAKMVLSLEKYN
jgi:acetolactate synthase-1/2/3 large subunit